MIPKEHMSKRPYWLFKRKVFQLYSWGKQVYQEETLWVKDDNEKG
jgi:hypothetical protein